MNIIEAIKSGKDFKRKSFDGWLSVHREEEEEEEEKSSLCGLIYVCDTGDNFDWREEDILADDWEIQEEKLELSWSEIEQVLETHFGLSNSQVFANLYEIKEKLGFK